MTIQIKSQTHSSHNVCKKMRHVSLVKPTYTLHGKDMKEHNPSTTEDSNCSARALTSAKPCNS